MAPLPTWVRITGHDSAPETSTDICLVGNVTYAVPGFHGMFTIPAEGVNHTPQFTNGAGSPEGYKRSLACAAGMAVVACQILVDDKVAEQVKKDFEKDD